MRTSPLRSRSRRRLAALGVVGALATFTGACAGTDTAGPGGPGGAGGPGDLAQGSGSTVPANPDLDADVALDPFTSCDELVGWIKEQALEKVTAYGLEGYGDGYNGGGVIAEDAMESGSPPVPTSAAPAPPGVDRNTGGEAKSSEAAPTEAGGTSDTPAHSGTNNQEKDVDEPDTVKTDGHRLFAVVGDELVSYVDLDTTPREVGRMQLSEFGGSGHQLLLLDDRLLVLSTDESYAYGGPVPLVEGDAVGGVARSPQPAGPLTIVEVVDVKDSALPHVLDRVGIDGRVVSARMTSGKLRVVTSSHPASFDFVYPNGRGAEKAAEAANRKIVEDSVADDWLPHMYRFGGGAKPEAPQDQQLLDCASVSRPKEFAGLGILAVLSIDPEGTVEPGANVGIVADGETVYASTANLYVTTNEPDELIRRRQGVTFHTSVHKFDIAGTGKAVYRASGKFDGSLLNQFSMSEHGGIFRAATTSSQNGTGASSGSSSQIVTMRETDGKLEVVGSVGGLGKNESIRSVRFLGDVGYVVTFRQTDPLYTIDLSNPEEPKVAGELKILGYSAYLHPVGDGLLLGIGQDATEQGSLLGTQVQLFDVKDPANPTAIQKLVVPGAQSEIETDHHAFLWWDASNLAVVPITKYPNYAIERCAPEFDCGTAGTSSQPFLGVVGFSVTRDAIREVGEVEHKGGSTGAKPSGGGICAPPGCDPIPSTTVWCPSDSTCPAPPSPIPPIPEPQEYPAQVTRSLVVGGNLITLSSAGLKANDLATFAERAWVPHAT